MSRTFAGDPVVVDYYVEDRSVDPPVPVDATTASTAADPDGTTVSVTPGHPALGHYTFTFLSGLPGVYRGVASATGAVTDVTPWAVQVWPAEARLWLPTPAQVHALIPLRPPFTATSRPTIDEVDELIDMAADAVASESPSGTFLTAQAGKTRTVIALSAAAQVESSYWPEQQGGPDSPSALLYARYQGELIGLRGILGQVDGVTRRAGTIRLGGAPRRDPRWGSC